MLYRVVWPWSWRGAPGALASACEGGRSTTWVCTSWDWLRMDLLSWMEGSMWVLHLELKCLSPCVQAASQQSCPEVSCSRVVQTSFHLSSVCDGSYLWITWAEIAQIWHKCSLRNKRIRFWWSEVEGQGHCDLFNQYLVITFVFGHPYLKSYNDYRCTKHNSSIY